MSQFRILRYFSVITAIFSYFMLLMGAIVTKTGSGYGCGNSWPFCHGQLIPKSLPIETVIEYSHRIVSGGVGFLILVLAIWCWRTYRSEQKVKMLSGMSLFFVILQGILGALTVVFRGVLAKKAALSLHFGFSLISFACVVLLCIYLHQIINKKQQVKYYSPKNLIYSTWGLWIYSYLIIYTGALVRHTGATMGCGYQFPTCGENIFPNLSSLAGIHLLHRFSAFSLLIITITYSIFIFRKYADRTDLVLGSWLANIFISLQAFTGVMIVFSGGQLWITLVHTTVISIFFLVISYLCMQVGPLWKRRKV